MAKIKVSIFSIALIIGYAASILILNVYSNYGNENFMQNSVFSTLLLLGISLYYINHRFRNMRGYHTFSLLFRVVAVLETAYAALGLYLILAFSHGIGF